MAREWAEGAELGDATTWTQVHGQPRAGQEALGWETPLEAYRPFLSYNELGSLLDEGPSKLYDALSKVLGLDALVDAQTALQQARSARDKARKEADQERQALLAQRRLILRHYERDIDKLFGLLTTSPPPQPGLRALSASIERDARLIPGLLAGVLILTVPLPRMDAAAQEGPADREQDLIHLQRDRLESRSQPLTLTAG